MGLIIASAAAVAVLSYQYFENHDGHREELYLLLLLATLGCAVLVVRHVNMQVSWRGCGMIGFLGVNVKEGHLKEAPEKGDNAQNCGGLLHEFLTNLAPTCRVCPPRPRVY